MPRTIYGYNGPPCVPDPIDTSLLTYIQQVNGILAQLNALKKSGVAIERLQLLLQEIALKRATLK